MHPDNLTAMDDTRSEEQRQEDIWREQERQVRETAKAVQFGCSTVARTLFNETVDDTDWKAGYAAACYEISELLMKQDVVRWAERAIGRPLPPPENPVPAHVCDGSGCCKEAKPATPAAGEDGALLRRMHQVDLNLNCSSHLAVHAMLDVLREAAARLRTLRADVARERDWRVQAEAERDRVLLRDDDALVAARAALAAEKIRADDLAAWVDHYRTKEASALARAEGAEGMIHEFDRRCEDGNCEKCSAIAAWLRARAAGEGGEKP